MELTQREIEERISLAEELDDVFFFLFALISGYLDSGKPLDIPFFVEKTKEKYEEVIKDIPEYNTDRERFEKFIDDDLQAIVETTIKHIDDEYYLSDDRAEFIAENDTNTILNTRDFVKAVRAGATKKRWLSMRDKLVRETHEIADGQTTNIEDAFIVGNSLMMFPRDTSLGADASEIVNCRCSIRYI